jgi:AcrR family transcriptional regulator
MEKDQKILHAAKSVFLKYGYTKTTMHDIAEAAGISRPGLYLIYSKKEEIYNALVESLSQELSKNVEERVLKIDEPLLQLKEVLNIWVIEMYAYLNQSPESKELYETQFSFAKEGMKRSTDLFTTDLEKVLKNFPSTSFNNNVKPKDVALIISSAVIGFKKNSDTLDELKEKIELLIRICIKN